MARPRLTQLIDSALVQCVVVSGPPGYGKTTLAREWAAGRERVAWYRATAASTDIAAFASGVVDAIGGVLPGVGDRLRQRLSVTDAPERDARVLAELLAADLHSWPDDSWLIIDDYHLASGSVAVEDFVDWLLALSKIRLLILSRRIPVWATARRELHGEVNHITRDQLAFTPRECQLVLGRQQDDASIDFVQKARGWPVLISLAALARDAQLPEEHVQHSLLRYLADEVFRSETAPVQELLLRISVPPSVTEDIASRILGVSEASSTLERLADDGLLTREEDSRFSLHPLLRKFLVEKFEAKRPSDYERIARRLLEHAVETEEWDEAVSLAAQRDLPEVIVEVISRAGRVLLASGRLQTLERWYEECGSTVFTEAEPLLVRAGLLIRRGEIGPARALAGELAEGIEETHPQASQANYVAGQAHHLLSETEAAFARHQRALDLARSPEDTRNALWGLFIAATELELENSNSYLEDLVAMKARELEDRLRVLSGRITAAPHLGSYASLSDPIEALLPYAESARDPMVASGFLMHAAYFYVAQARYGDGLRLADRALGFCRSLSLDFATAYCRLYRVSALIGLRQGRQAQRDLDLLELERGRDPFLAHQAQALNLRLALSTTGGTRTLPGWTLDPPARQPPRAGQGEVLALQALVHVTRGDWGRAAELATCAVESSRSIEARLVGAVAAAAATDPHVATDEGAARLVGLVKAMMKAEYGDGLVLAYRAIPELLRAVKTDPDVARYARQVLKLADDGTLGVGSGLMAGASADGRFADLTARETEILELLAEGWRNDEISKKLFISTNTTKAHVHHVLKKLGVTSRLQAAVLYKEDQGQNSASAGDSSPS